MSMTKQDKLDIMLNDVETWDTDNLIGYVIDSIEVYYKGLDDEDFEQEWRDNFADHYN